MSAPVFYYATKHIYLTEADDTLKMHKAEFLKDYAGTLTIADIPSWNYFNRNIRIDSGRSLAKDSLFFTSYYDKLDNEDEPYRELNVPITIEGRQYIYVERFNLVETADLLMNIAVLFTVIMILLLAGLFIINRSLSRRLWQPFYKTLAVIEGFEIDKTALPGFAPTGIEEFNRLNNSIGQLVKRNLAIYRSQKEFIENAAHELQTPLAVFQAKIDTLMQSEGVTSQQAAMLTSINENIFRLNRLNKNLLLLSKIDHDQYAEKQAVDMVELIKKNFDFFREQAVAKELDIQHYLEAAPKPLANPALAEVLISNLFMNAIRHNIVGGYIRITVKDDAIIFANSGQALPLIRDKLFNRFSKVNPSEQGTGLGLSIVEKIATLHQWTVSYAYNAPEHVFTIQF